MDAVVSHPPPTTPSLECSNGQETQPSYKNSLFGICMYLMYLITRPFWMTLNITYLTHIYTPRRQTLKYAYTAAPASAASATPTYSFLTLLLLAASLTLSSSSDLATTFCPSSLAAFSPSSCFTVLFDSGAASAPCLRSDSLRQLICPPSASRCICALRFAAVMDVRAYLLLVSRHAMGVWG